MSYLRRTTLVPNACNNGNTKIEIVCACPVRCPLRSWRSHLFERNTALRTTARGILGNVLPRARFIKSTQVDPRATMPLFRVGRPAVIQKIMNTYHPIRYRSTLYNLGATLTSLELRKLSLFRHAVLRTAQNGVWKQVTWILKRIPAAINTSWSFPLNLLLAVPKRERGLFGTARCCTSDLEEELDNMSYAKLTDHMQQTSSGKYYWLP